MNTITMPPNHNPQTSVTSVEMRRRMTELYAFSTGVVRPGLEQPVVQVLHTIADAFPAAELVVGDQIRQLVDLRGELAELLGQLFNLRDRRFPEHVRE